VKLFVSTTFLPDSTPLFEALLQCKQAEIKAVEIGSNHCYENSYDYLSDFRFEFLVHNYFPIPKDSFVLNIASLDERIRERSIQHIKKAIDFCCQIDAKLYTFHPGFLTDPRGSNTKNDNYDFQWDETKLQNSNYQKAKRILYLGLDEVVKYAQSRNLAIAIETEGSLKKRDHLLMQRPEEYEDLMKNYTKGELGINLNIGHLNLAANAFLFDRLNFIDLIQDQIVAMELSHNNGQEDQHLPIRNDCWYFDLIHDLRFKDAYKILEFRNTPINRIKKNIELIKDYRSVLSTP